MEDTQPVALVPKDEEEDIEDDVDEEEDEDEEEGDNLLSASQMLQEAGNILLIYTYTNMCLGMPFLVRYGLSLA